MNPASLKAFVDALFAAAEAQFKNNLVIVWTLQAANKWIDGILVPVAARLGQRGFKLDTSAVQRPNAKGRK